MFSEGGGYKSRAVCHGARTVPTYLYRNLMQMKPLLNYRTCAMATRSRFITAPSKNMLIFLFYSIFELKFHYKTRKNEL